jgi:hypothetical protein
MNDAIAFGRRPTDDEVDDLVAFCRNGLRSDGAR